MPLTTNTGYLNVEDNNELTVSQEGRGLFGASTAYEFDSALNKANRLLQDQDSLIPFVGLSSDELAMVSNGITNTINSMISEELSYLKNDYPEININELSINGRLDPFVEILESQIPSMMNDHIELALADSTAYNFYVNLKSEVPNIKDQNLIYKMIDVLNLPIYTIIARVTDKNEDKRTLNTAKLTRFYNENEGVLSTGNGNFMALR